MKFWNEYPLYRLLIPMIIGIYFGNIYQNFTFPIVFIIILFLLLALWVFRPIVFRKYGWRFISGMIISSIFLLAGYQLTAVHSGINKGDHYSQTDSISHLLVRINSPLIEKEKTFKVLGKILAVYQNTDTAAKVVNGNILLYFDKNSLPELEYGQEILIVNKIKPIISYGNPNEFDYAAYLKKQNIYHQMYLKRTDWVLTNHQSPNFIIQWGYQARNLLLEILRDFQFSDREFAVATAILLGYDEYLDQDLRQLYAGSGAMHILCVSGLHVGIIFLIFNTLLAF
ncbi:MAG: DUF4131 domain-containing protein, partial [Bacteroidales bacterium]|nr:DUF4131 domain-containing protein [Bacteroidales bacterium]